MDIGYYIADLLRNQDDVSLPGIGTFVKVRVPGSYHAASNSFTPPSYRVSLREFSDSIESLARHISINKNLSQTSAEYFIKKFISSIFDLLQSTGIAEIKPLGILRKDDERLSFEASPDLKIGGKFYGLKEVKEQVLRHPPEEERLFQNVFREEKVSMPEAAMPDNMLVEEEAAEMRSSFGLAKVLGLVVLTLIIIAGLAYVYNPIVKESVNKFIASVSPQRVIPAPAGKERHIPGLAVPERSAAAVNDSSMIDTPKLASVAEPVDEEKQSYEIIGGSFGRMSEAETYIQQLSLKGISAKIAHNIPGNLVKVSLGSFDDEQSAQKELNRIHKEVNKEAWIYRPKLKKNP